MWQSSGVRRRHKPYDHKKPIRKGASCREDTISDFDNYCRQHHITVRERLVITEGKTIHLFPNLLGSLAMYRCGIAP